MYYTAQLVKRKKLFQKPYEIAGEKVFITDTKRCKKKFLKSGIKNVLFPQDMKNDHIFGKLLIEAKKVNRDFELQFLDEMINHTISFLKMEIPINEIAIFSSFSESLVSYCIPYGKLITLVGKKGEREIIDGVNIRRVKKLKNIPDFVVEDGDKGVSPIFNVPGVHIGEGECLSKKILCSDTISFKTNIYAEEINLYTLLYLLEKEGDFEYELTSLRKKCPILFTFG